jgi:hypothetical protein
LSRHSPASSRTLFPRIPSPPPALSSASLSLRSAASASRTRPSYRPETTSCNSKTPHTQNTPHHSQTGTHGISTFVSPHSEYIV